MSVEYYRSDDPMENFVLGVVIQEVIKCSLPIKLQPIFIFYCFLFAVGERSGRLRRATAAQGYPHLPALAAEDLLAQVTQLDTLFALFCLC